MAISSAELKNAIDKLTKNDLDGEPETVGIKINLPVDKVIGATTESRQRKKGTMNAPPTMFSKEAYNVLIVSIETGVGIENPSFEVANAENWARAIQSVTGGERL